MSAALFVDGSFLRKAWREVGGHSLLRYDALRSVVEREACDTIAVAYWFDAQFPETPANDKHRAALLRAGFRPRTHYRVVTEIVRDRVGRPIEDPLTKTPLTTYRQKGVDVALARTIERSHHADKWTHLVLAAGDADFAELVEDLVERDGVRATLLGPPKSISLAFRPFANRIIDLQRHVHELALLRSA
jgi:uncharacterized LabA/DUF88 family protein